MQTALIRTSTNPQIIYDDPGCGSPIVVKSDSVPHIVAIRTESLYDPSWFSLQMDVWTSDAHPWDQMNPALPKFEKYPN